MIKHSILSLSIHCISKNTADCVNNACFEHIKLFGEMDVYEKGMKGWFISVPDNFENVLIPDDLRCCLEKAKENDCCWIIFDRDIEFENNDGLQRYNWQNN